MTKIMMDNADHVRGKILVQKGKGRYIVQNMPAKPLDQRELDAVYDLPYIYGYPEVYDRAGGVKALDEVRFSLTHNRGCFGSCNFCSIALHQGRFVVGRSHDSVLREAQRFTAMKDFKGYIHDVGGATANFRVPAALSRKRKAFAATKNAFSRRSVPRFVPTIGIICSF